MRTRSLVTIVLLTVAAGPAMAQQPGARAGETSGAAVGGNVVPSTVLQKRVEGRSAFEGETSAIASEPSALAAGVPGIEGKRGAQSGAAAREGEPGRPVY